MKRPQEALLAYLCTLAAIVLLPLIAAVIVVFGPMASAEDVARMLGALSFIGAAETGLIGVIGTFRPKGAEAAETKP